jgi:hypothetical protein
MRAAEMQRIQGLMAKRLGLYFRLLGGSAADAGNALQPLFSWNPQDVSTASPGNRPRPCRPRQRTAALPLQLEPASPPFLS